MSDLLDIMTTGHPCGPVNFYLVGSKDRIIATGLIPASAFAEASTFREDTFPTGVGFTVARLCDDDRVWDVWLGFPQDTWLEELDAEQRAEDILAMRTRAWRDIDSSDQT